jgi:hypothetical protein
MFIKIANQGDNQLWKYIVTILAVIVAYVVGQIPISILIYGKMMNGSVDMDQVIEFQETLDFSLIGMDQNLSLLLLLLSFVAAFFTLILLYPRLHQKPLRMLVTSRPKMDWSRIFFAFGVWLLLTAILEVIVYQIDPANYVYQLDWAKFIPLLAIALLILPIQTSFEELLFRGYLLHGISLISAYRWIPIIVTSILFGLMHIFNPEIEKFGMGLMMSYYIGVGLVLAICTVMDEGMEIALGIHAATNIYGATVVSFSGSALQTPTIYRIQELDAQMMLLVGFALALVFILIVAKKYNWSDWSKLYRPIDFDIEEQTPETIV